MVECLRNEQLTSVLTKGGVAVIPTDTLYGIVARAQDDAAVLRIYQYKGRDPRKPCIILLSHPEDSQLFGCTMSQYAKAAVSVLWPGPVSVILPVQGSSSQRAHFDTDSLAFRVPNSEPLRDLIRSTGPLVAPSANPEGKSPAATVPQAKGYFGDRVDFYCDGGTARSEPSTLVRIDDDGYTIIRRGQSALWVEEVLYELQSSSGKARVIKKQ